jgi:hypothetical protein
MLKRRISDVQKLWFIQIHGSVCKRKNTRQYESAEEEVWLYLRRDEATFVALVRLRMRLNSDFQENLS